MSPCLKALDAECFASNPQWAKQAFAYRLVHMLTPKQLTRRLPKGIRQALLAPGITLPPGLEMPPGTIIAPGSVFPPGWQPGDPLPPGAIPPGAIPPGAEASGPTPPTYAEVWSPGPVSTAPPGGAVAPEPWFYDPFDSIDYPPWTADSDGTGSVSIVSGKLKLLSNDSGDYAMLIGTENAEQPDTFTWTWELTLESGTGEAFLSLWTGSHQLRIGFIQPTTVRIRHQNPTVDKVVAVDNFLNQTITWKITYNGTQFTLHRGATLIDTITDPTVDAWGQGYGEITVEDVCVAYFDDYTITPL